MIATAALAGHLLAEADFSSSDRRRATGMYWMTAALAGQSLTKAGFSPLRARISGARSAALFDPLRVK